MAEKPLSLRIRKSVRYYGDLPWWIWVFSSVALGLASLALYIELYAILHPGWQPF